MHASAPELLLALWPVLAAYLLGAVALRLTAIAPATAVGRFSLSLALGYGLLGTALFVQGLLGAFHRANVVAALGGATALGLAGLWHLRPVGLTPLRLHCPPGQRALWTATVLAFVLALPRALVPETEGDALCYHLELPKRFLELGRIEFLPWTDQSLFPLLSDLCFAAPLALGVFHYARLGPFFWGCALVGAVAELCIAAGHRRLAPWAALLTATAPILTNHATVCFADLPTTLYGTWGLALALGRCRGTPRNRAIVAGLMLGFAAASKLTGLAWAACVMTALTARVLRSTRKLGTATAAALALAVVAAPWYVRSYVYTGNPFYPYFGRLFPDAWQVHERRPSQRLPVNPLSLRALALPALVTLQPERFGGAGHQWGIAFLAFLPGAVAAVHRRPRALLMSLAVVPYLLAWAAMKQNLRFLMPAMPVAALWSAAGIFWLLEQRRKTGYLAVACAVAVQVAAGWSAALRRTLPCVRRAAGLESVEAYLKRREPTFQVARVLSNALQPGAAVLTQEHRIFYFDVPIVREDALHRWLGYRSSGPELSALLSRLGFTHVLLARSANPSVARYDQSLRQRLGSELDSSRRILELTFRGPGGDCRTYELYRLPVGSSVTPPADVDRARWLMARQSLRWFIDGHVYGNRSGASGGRRTTQAAGSHAVRSPLSPARAPHPDTHRPQPSARHLRLLRPPVLALPHRRLPQWHVPGSGAGAGAGSRGP